MIRIRVLGAFDAEVNRTTVQLGGPRQRAVLALLIAARGDVVSVDRLIEDLWRGEPPAKAIASLQTYVANLRRALEPDRPPRAPARVLVSAAPGYAVRLGGDEVDAWRFERLVEEARQRIESRPSEARTLLGEGLTLWRGQAFAEVADEEWAVAEAARLEEQRLAAGELFVAATLRSAPAADAVPVAEMLTRRQPLREEGWRLLALALWGSGRQADALSALRRARHTLADELGLDPDPALVTLEDAILGQRVEVLHASLGDGKRGRPAASVPVAAPADGSPRLTSPDGSPSLAPAHGAPGRPALFVGRTAELATLDEAARDVLAGMPRIAVVTGEAGAGKSALLGRLQEGLDPASWLVAVGRCPETDGAPPAWAWLEALRPLARVVPPGEHEAALSPLLGEGHVIEDASAGRFRLHRAVSAWLRAIAGNPSNGARRALAIVLDDVHRADAETLALLASVAGELAGTRILLVVALRPSDVTEAQEDALAALARHSPVRVQLGGLSGAEVETLVTSVCDRPVDPATLSSLAERTGGNPFYVWESARLLASEGTLSDVPEGVRDVLRRRLSRLPAAAVSVLRLAAVVGREAEVEVLVNAADGTEDAVLDALEAGVFSGLLTEPSPGRVRFVHALVRDTLYQDLSQVRRTRMHARVAAALRELHPDDLTALAYHYARAASSATAPMAVDYSVRAAEMATRRYAHDTAAELLSQALDCFDRVAGAADHDARRVALLGELLRAQVRAGDVVAARASRQRAVGIAVQSGRDDLLIAAFTSWTEATPWQTRPYGTIDADAVRLLGRLLRRTDLEPVTRCLLLAAFVAEMDSEGDPRSLAAAQEAVALVEHLDHPALKALAITLLIKETSFEHAPDERAALAIRLRALADDHDLVVYRWFAEYTLATAAGDAAMLRAHVGRSMEIAQTYQMAEALSVGMCAQAVLAHVGGRFDEAERLYGLAYEKMRREGSIHAYGVYSMALTSIRISQGRIGEQEGLLRALCEQYGPSGADGYALALAANGRVDEARAVRVHRPPLRNDYFRAVFATLRAMAVVALGERDEAEEMMEVLLPYRDQLPGAPSTSLVLRPVAHSLGELALLLDRPGEAAGHFAHAVEVARRWDAPVWEKEALAALSKTAPRGPQDR
ncbi:BTAD domain-containing putative transcriptional regulator [Planotetraspora sp. GP83]|uniref:BTAD domain-containing putative transcriptional regulator n=1 Tax=Planotetraspora sp. GP83 TaxID=3156264 RepID=UPI003511E4AA